MKKKVVWLVVSCWMVAALLLASCAPAVVEEEEEKVAPPVKEEEVVVPKEEVVPEKETNMVKWTGKKRDGTVVEKMLEKPRYGGTHVAVKQDQPVTFDDLLKVSAGTWNTEPTNEELITRDWAKGPGGTGEWAAQHSVFARLGDEACVLAESWELPAPDTLVFHIRQGVHWALDPTSEASRLVGGRELTADDVVFNLIRQFNPKYYTGNRSPYLIDMVNRENSIYVSPTDKWAVVIKVKSADMMGNLYESAADVVQMAPPEVVEKYGDMANWKNVVGTGPFILEEYVGASSLTYVRNPNYWQKDPFFPENQLPYIDDVKCLIIPDRSTQVAALRTGKVDCLPALEAEDAEQLFKSNPELERVIHPGSSTPSIFMRVDKPEQPFYDLRVRRALMLAINHPEIRDVYYDGKADLTCFPIVPIPEFMDMYVPIEEMPESVRELYEYHPDKAKQLLAEAGYPQGFKTTVITANAPALYVDLLSLVKEYWAAIGVDLTIDVREPTIVSTIGARKTYTQMLMGGTTSYNPWNLTMYRTGLVLNKSNISDQKVDEAYVEMTAAYFDEPKKNQIMKDLVPYMDEQAWMIALPIAYGYTLWQPWLKGYYGATQIGYMNSFSWPTYAWIDQELKKAMGH